MKKTLALLLLGTLILSGCGVNGTQPPPKQAVAVEEPSRPVFIMAGKVDAIEKVDVASKGSGRVSELKVDVGSFVHQGDVLLSLDAKDKEALVKQAEAAIETANANYAGTVAAYESARLNYERILQLFEAGAASEQALDTAEIQQKTAEAQKEAAAAQCVSARSQLDVANTNLGDATIIAPISGVVSSKNIHAGEMAVAGSKLLSIVNPDFLCINAYLPARLSGDIKQGQKVVISLSEITGKLFNGEITMVDAVVDTNSKTILVKVAFSEKDPAIKVGMLAEIALQK